jgi:hypothetical protein
MSVVYLLKNKIIAIFVKSVATKKGKRNFPPPPRPHLLLLDPGFEIRDPGSWMDKNQDPGSGLNIPDPQHCLEP